MIYEFLMNVFPTNQNLEVSPGILKVTIQSKGYKAKTIKVKAIKNKASNYKIKLARKVAPKPKKVIAKRKRVRSQARGVQTS